MIRSRHPQAKLESTADSFWISRLSPPKEERANNRYWSLSQRQSDSGPENFRTLSQSGRDFWGRKFEVNRANPTTRFRFRGIGTRVFFEKHPGQSASLPASYEYSFGSSSPHYRTLSSHTRVLDYPGVSPNNYFAGVSFLHTTGRNKITEQTNASLLITSWITDQYDDIATPDNSFDLISNWWFLTAYARSAIFSSTPVSHDIVGEAMSLLLEGGEYKFIGDFYLALQKRLRSKNKSRALNSLVLFGNGAALMPSLDISTINRYAAESLYPDSFGGNNSNDIEEEVEEDDSLQDDSMFDDSKTDGARKEERMHANDSKSKNSEPVTQASTPVATGYSGYVATAVNMAIMAAYTLLQRKAHPQGYANSYSGGY